MLFRSLALDGLVLVQPERRDDDRGHFARTFCEDEFAAHALPSRFPQTNTSFNTRRGTLRGLHWQAEPHPEGKLVRCTQGAIVDVAVDVRTGSPTYGQHVAVELSAANGDALYIPPGFAHGFQTLEDATEVFYMMTERYHADLARGLRFDDPALAITWPVADRIVSSRDAELPFLRQLIESATQSPDALPLLPRSF